MLSTATPAPEPNNFAFKPRRASIDPNQIVYISEKQKQAVADLIREFTLLPTKLKAIKDHFLQEMRKGLEKEGQTIAMVPSHVVGRLYGSEIGVYLTLDLGGTFLRVVSVELLGQGRMRTVQKKYRIHDERKVSEAKLLFEYMASCVDSFMDEHAIIVPSDAEIELGFTFSYPVLQTAINSGTLIAWTKGFSCPGMVHKDPAAFLQDAFRRRNMPIRVAALLNDTVGTLLAHAYRHPRTVIGLGLGTGTNGAYIERVDRIPKWKGPLSNKETEMVINMEFGAFDSELLVLPVTMYDHKVDQKSPNKGQQIFEKMIAGMYLGEITRNILVDLIDRRLLFTSCMNIEMNRVWALDTAYMSSIEADSTPNLDDTQRVLERVLCSSSKAAVDESSKECRATIVTTTLVDRKIVKVVVGLVGQRAARLSAMAVAGILEHTKGVAWCTETGADIGVDGSLFMLYPSFGCDILDALEEIFEQESGMKGVVVVRTDEAFEMMDMCEQLQRSRGLEVRMRPCVDGSGVGAALCALLATRITSIGDSI
ncbi:hexokinase A [Mortierella polycephala]|uniref:Phosphotransferase n=1 Tax=Mortierella polycephala TaxID=41804 RepID=A0A9P6PNR9_9FUNG|nr:hexokinase A [Mortierella polycephala]